MVNCNPETVSTDYDTSDRLYFEPLTLEDVLGVIEVEQPEGVIVQFGGQTPLKLADGLAQAGVPLLGTPVDAIDLAEDRARFGELLAERGLQRPGLRDGELDGRGAGGRERGRLPAARPALIRARRPGDGDRLLDGTQLADYLRRERGGGEGGSACCSTASSRTRSRSTWTRCATASEVAIGGIMQHVEEAGVHSGDSRVRDSADVARRPRCSREIAGDHRGSRCGSASSA